MSLKQSQASFACSVSVVSDNVNENLPYLELGVTRPRVAVCQVITLYAHIHAHSVLSCLTEMDLFSLLSMSMICIIYYRHKCPEIDD